MKRRIEYKIVKEINNQEWARKYTLRGMTREVDKN